MFNAQPAGGVKDDTVELSLSVRQCLRSSRHQHRRCHYKTLIGSHCHRHCCGRCGHHHHSRRCHCQDYHDRHFIGYQLNSSSKTSLWKIIITATGITTHTAISCHSHHHHHHHHHHYPAPTSTTTQHLNIHYLINTTTTTSPPPEYLTSTPLLPRPHITLNQPNYLTTPTTSPPSPTPLPHPTTSPPPPLPYHPTTSPPTTLPPSHYLTTTPLNYNHPHYLTKTTLPHHPPLPHHHPHYLTTTTLTATTSGDHHLSQYHHHHRHHRHHHHHPLSRPGANVAIRRPAQLIPLSVFTAMSVSWGAPPVDPSVTRATSRQCPRAWD